MPCPERAIRNDAQHPRSIGSRDRLQRKGQSKIRAPTEMFSIGRLRRVWSLSGYEATPARGSVRFPARSLCNLARDSDVLVEAIRICRAASTAASQEAPTTGSSIGDHGSTAKRPQGLPGYFTFCVVIQSLRHIPASPPARFDHPRRWSRTRSALPR